jgi:hypothetical protein
MTPTRHFSGIANDTRSSRTLPPATVTTSSRAATVTAPSSTNCSRPLPESRNVECPTPTVSLPVSGCTAIGRPLTKVPFWLAKSAISKPPSGRLRSSAW